MRLEKIMSKVVPPIAIDINHPLTCQFCNVLGEETRALLLPWKDKEGWWSCVFCKDVATTCLARYMDGRYIIGISALPEWFREWGLFSVRRTNGELAEMVLVDVECDFCHNRDNEIKEGRIRLTTTDDPEVYVDMTSVDNHSFKQVQLQNLYESNPTLLHMDLLELTFPHYVSLANREKWTTAVNRAIFTAKKKLECMPDSPVSTHSETVDDSTAPATGTDENLSDEMLNDKTSSDDAPSILDNATLPEHNESETITPAAEDIEALTTVAEFKFWE